VRNNRVQVVILAGGLATRLGELSLNTPKSMIPIEGKPFLEYQIDLLKHQGFREILLCVGHLGEMIEAYFGRGDRLGVDLTYSWEPVPLGTGGALKNAESLLQEEFILLYGDSFLPIDYATAIKNFRLFNKLATMVVYKNFNKYDKSNVVVNEQRILIYAKNVEHPEMYFIDAGLTLYKKEVVDLLLQGQKVDLGLMIQKLVFMGELFAWEINQRFYEIGSLKGLEDFQSYVKKHKACQ
jgi:N-acetyl-alpha-D-muramate 1-phosphate uridylyltransferase